jgi:hypothetical protein
MKRSSTSSFGARLPRGGIDARFPGQRERVRIPVRISP